MIKYCIMALMMGYSGNKLFGKDRSTRNSMLVAIKVGIVLILINLLIILI
ncbi:hypothetical protein [Clostridium sp. HMP27]|nr:hypothetical protein [Clostridium sp. HMP27]